MWSFQYKHGDRPLDGFTIQRAAGRGGFGEVYYALSDSGREVALKAVQGYEQIELRGISQCMNLKSPHLVTIFDVKYNTEGRPFVVMEFVNGPSLRQLLDESPAGLGTQKAAFFLREMGKGLTFLHECGIVHRDLKPGNVFFENGYVKIGDYGLSKAISPTQHSGQTVTVGTVHYMAPEIGVGKYDRSIDIYAMGAVLYEMLTGTVPFIGASPSEILMKHLSAEPDMGGVPEPFNTVIRKAMAKDPAQRYASIQEMVEAVFGTEHVRMSMSHFSPDDLSMVAGRVAQKMAIGGAGSGGSSSVVGGSNDAGQRPLDPFAQAFGRLQDGRDRLRESLQDSRDRLRENLQGSAQRMRERFGIGGINSDPNEHPIPPIPNQPQSTARINDPLPLFSRQVLAFLTAIVVSIAAGILTADQARRGSLTAIAVPTFVFCAIVGASLGLVIGWRKLAIPMLRHESHSVRKLAVGTVVAASTLLCSGWIWLILVNQGHFSSGTVIAVLAPLCFFNTWEWARANRKERVTLGPAIWVGFIAFILSGMFSGDPVLAIAVVAGTALAVQVISPWDPQLAGTRGTIRSGGSPSEAPSPMKVYGNVTVDPDQAEAMRAAGVQVYGNMHVRDELLPRSSQRGGFSTALADYLPVPRGAHFIWLGMFIILLTTGLMGIIAASNVSNHDAPPFVGLAVAGCLAAAFSFVRIFTRRFFGWWSYLIRPGLMMIFGMTIMISAVVAGNVRLQPDEQLVAGFFIIFPSLLFLTMPFLPRRFGARPMPQPYAGKDSPHTKSMAFGMCWLWFCGAAGIQRFYVGKIGTGILWLVTGGFFGIGQLIDMIRICNGTFTDAQGRVLRHWDEPMTTPETAQAIAGAVVAPPPIIPSQEFQPQEFQPQVNQPVVAPQLPNAIPPSVQATNIIRAASGGLVSVATVLLLLVTLLFTLAIGLDLPQAIANGLPDASSSAEIRSAIFHGSPMWSVIVTKLLYLAATALAIITSGMMMAARRRTTLPHILRGLVGMAGLIAAVIVLTAPFNAAHAWGEISQKLAADHSDQAMDAFTNYFRGGDPLIAAGICVASLLMLSIPYRRRAQAEKGLA